MDLPLSALISMIHNVAVLIAVGLLLDVFASRWLVGKIHMDSRCLLGFCLGIVGMLVMLTPWAVTPGIHVDARSVLIGIAGLFFGLVPTLIAMGMTSALRLYEGGAGASTGVLMILASGFIGLVWRHWRHKQGPVSWQELCYFGLIIHIVVLALMFTLPHEIGGPLFSHLILPVLLLGTGSTALLGSMMNRRIAHGQAEEALRESEERFRLLYQSAPIAYQSLDAGGIFLDVNKHFCTTMGYTPEEVIGTNFSGLLHPDWLDHFKENFPRFKAVGEVLGVELQLRKKSGDYILVSLTGRVGKNLDGTFRQTYCVFRDITKERIDEELFRAAALKHKIIFENSPLGMIYFDTLGIVADCNDTFVDLMGSSREQILGFNTLRDSSPKMIQALQKAIAGSPSTFEDTYTSVTGGKTLYLRAIFTPVNPGVSPTEVIATLEDVTEKQHAEEMLRESEIRFRTLHNASFGGIAIHDKGIILDCNQGLSEVSGYAFDELVGMDGLQLVAESYRQMVLDNILSGHEKPYEAFGRRKNGEEYPLRLEAKNIPYKGKNVRVVEFRDITEQKLAEQELRRSEERFRSIIEDVEVAVQGYDRNLRVVYWNKASEQLYGYTEQEAIGESLLDLIIPEAMREKVVMAVDNWIENDIIVPAKELVLRHKDGSDVHVYVSYALQRKADGAVELFCVDLDLSESMKMRKALLDAKEQAEASSRSKSEFLANMSHELRTPLNGIVGMLQLMEETALNDEQSGYAKVAIESSRRLTSLLSDILDLSRIEAGKLEIRSEPVDLRDAVHSVEQLFLPSAKQADTRIVVHIAEAIPTLLLGDTFRLQQVISNLVGNALKFTPCGVITVEAFPLPAVTPGSYRVLFSVSDTGEGIPDDKLNILFEPFTQADGGLARQHQGAGLGLSICKRLAALMGGHISIASELGKGTTVHFCATFGTVVHKGDKPAKPVRVDVGTVQSYHILVAEDEQVNRVLVTRLLEKYGHTVVAVVNGKQAVEALRDGDFGIVLMDIQMPVMDGMEATLAIQNGEAGERNRDIPIVALTAHAMAGDREVCMASGMCDYLTKPFEKDDLLNVLRWART